MMKEKKKKKDRNKDNTHVNPSPGVGAADALLLAFHSGRVDARALSVRARAACVDDGVDAVAVAHGSVELLQDEHDGTLADEHPLRVPVV